MPSGPDLGGRVLAAVLVLAAGIVHLKLYFDGYRDIDKIGPSFLLMFIASVVVAVLLVVWRHWLALVLALALVDATLVGFGLARTGRGIFDFNETGWNPSPEAALSVAFEIAAAIVLVVLLARALRPRDTETAVTA